MKKLIPFILLGLILSSCAGGFSNLTSLITSPTPPLPTDTATPQPTVTMVPTQDFFVVPTSTPVTLTPTSTSLIPTELLPTITPIPLPTFSQEFINDLSGTTFFAQTVGFKRILLSDTILYWDQGPCTTRRIKVTVLVDDPALTDRVFMFTRLRDKKNSLNTGGWSAGAEMIKVQDGSFNYNLEPKNIRRYYYYKDAWVEYEFVSVNNKLEVIGRTKLYDKSLSLVECRYITAP
jgi:hypothetical protein